MRYIAKTDIDITRVASPEGQKSVSIKSGEELPEGMHPDEIALLLAQDRIEADEPQTAPSDPVSAPEPPDAEVIEDRGVAAAEVQS